MKGSDDNEFDDRRPIDPTYLYIRTDEKYEEVRAELHDMAIKVKDQENTLNRVEKRVDFGVAVTGKENAEAIGKHAVEIGKIQQRQDLLEQKLTDPDTGFGRKLDDIGKAVNLIYRGILGIFFTILCGGAVLWSIRFFKP